MTTTTAVKRVLSPNCPQGQHDAHSVKCKAHSRYKYRRLRNCSTKSHKEILQQEHHCYQTKHYPTAAPRLFAGRHQPKLVITLHAFLHQQNKHMERHYKEATRATDIMTTLHSLGHTYIKRQVCCHYQEPSVYMVHSIWQKSSFTINITSQKPYSARKVTKNCPLPMRPRKEKGLNEFRLQ